MTELANLTSGQFGYTIAPMRTFRDIIDLWSPRVSLASEIEGATPNMVHKWHRKGSIPAAYWRGLVVASERRGFDVTLAELAQIAAGEAEGGGGK